MAPDRSPAFDMHMPSLQALTPTTRDVMLKDMRAFLACVPFLCAATTLSSADDIEALLRGEEQLSWVQIRLGLGQSVIPDEFPIYTAGDSPAWTDTTDADHATSVSYGIVSANLTPVGLVKGIEIVYNSTSMDITGRTAGGSDVPIPDDACGIRYDSIGGNLLLGAGLALGPHAHVEVLGVAGGGACNLGFADATLTHQENGSGVYWNYGVRGGAYYRIRRFVIGAVVAYEHVKIDASEGGSAFQTETDADASGIGYRIELGYHIN